MSVFVTVSNLGPLRCAEVELADLTLLIGENNTGKTFFATVAHRILAAGRAEPPDLPGLGRMIPEDIREWFDAQRARLDQPSLPIDADAHLPKSVLAWADGITTARLEAFGAEVRDGIEYAYGVDASQLRRRTPSRRASDSYVRVRNTRPDWQVEVRFDSEEVLVEPPDAATWVQGLLNDEKTHREPAPKEGTRQRPARRSQLTRLMSGYGFGWPVAEDLFSGWPRFAVHLPANRTGIMQSYQVLAGTVVRQSAAAGIRPITVDALPGTAADFISLLVSDPKRQYPHRRGKTLLSEPIASFESELRAEIGVRERADDPDSVVAVTPEGEFPLSLVSSMLSELAPVILVLKGSLGRSDHITVDEPEAHLHPAMQRRVASFLSDVVRLGTGVVVTTHSDFFLGEINNLIRSRKLTDSQAAPRTNGGSGSRRPTVCAVRFARDDRWCTGQPLSLDPVDGIDESTFTDVMESLYDDSVELINGLL